MKDLDEREPVYLWIKKFNIIKMYRSTEFQYESQLVDITSLKFIWKGKRLDWLKQF